MFRWAWLLVGCSEYDFPVEPLQGGVPFPQPLPVLEREDTFLQSEQPQVDVLWVVDNSCSMSEEQDAIAANFPLFAAWFVDSGLDYHIGVISTDMQDPSHSGKLQSIAGIQWIDRTTLDPIGTFAAMAQLGTGGAASESGRAAAYTAIELKGDTDNAGFIRDAATLHLIVVSDEPDQSGEVPIGLDEWVQYLLTVKESPDRVSHSAIVGPPGGCGLQAEEGSGYIEVTERVGGILHPICTEEWDVVLDQLGEHAAGIRTEFFLSEIPVPGTISVSVIDEGVQFDFYEGTDFTYNPTRNSITFLTYVPDPMAEVILRYEALTADAGD